MCFTVAATMGPASAGTPSATVTPGTGLSDGQALTVAIVSDVTVAGHFYAATICGNATSAGAPTTPGNQGDCATTPTANGSAGLQLVSNSGNAFPLALGGGLTAGVTYTTTITAHKTGIGANAAQCVPVGGAITASCTVAVAESDATQAQYGQTFVPITYTAPATTTTTSTDVHFDDVDLDHLDVDHVHDGRSDLDHVRRRPRPGLDDVDDGGSDVDHVDHGGSRPRRPRPLRPRRPRRDPDDVDHRGSDHLDHGGADDQGLRLQRHPAGDLDTGVVEEPLPRPRGDGDRERPGRHLRGRLQPDHGLAALRAPVQPRPGHPDRRQRLQHRRASPIGAIGADGSIAPTDLVVKTGPVGSDPRSVCPPTQAQADAGVVNCVIAAAPGRRRPPRRSRAQFTVAGQTVTLPVDASGNPTPPPTTPAGSGGADVLGTTQTTATAVTAKGTLPYTGLGGNTWFIVGMAILLIDVGAVASSFAKRRMVG